MQAGGSIEHLTIQAEFRSCRKDIFSGFAQMTKELAASVKVPVGLHLDHSYNYRSVMQAIHGGFDSVMIDASAHELDENIAVTRKVVETAHIFGVDVEAEIGHVGLAQDCDGDKSDFYTKADAAERFCRETAEDAGGSHVRAGTAGEIPGRKIEIIEVLK